MSSGRVLTLQRSRLSDTTEVVGVEDEDKDVDKVEEEEGVEETETRETAKDQEKVKVRVRVKVKVLGTAIPSTRLQDMLTSLHSRPVSATGPLASQLIFVWSQDHVPGRISGCPRPTNRKLTSSITQKISR